MVRMSRPPLHRVLADLGVVAFFLLLALVATWPLATDLGGQTLAGLDPLIDLWTVHWLSGHAFHPREIFGGNIFFPHSNAVLYSDLSMGTVVFLLPLRLFVDDPVLLYNLALLTALTFAGWSFYALTRELSGSLWAGVLAGVLAAFGSHQLSHVYHLNLLTTGWLALFLLGLHRLLRRPTWGPILLAGVSFALSAQSSGYYAVASAVLALVFVAAHWRAFREPRLLAAAGGAALLGALLVAPYLRAFLELREREGLRRPIGVSAGLAFHPGRDLTSCAYAYRAALGSQGERLFPGVLTLVLAGLALSRRRPSAGLYAAGALVLLALSLGPRLDVAGHGVVLPYRWLFAIPPLDGMRHPFTFAAVATFVLSVVAGLGFAGLPLASGRWAGPAVVLAAVAETLAPPPLLRPIPGGLPPAYERLGSLPPGPVLEVPVFAEETLVWAARHGRPTANGQGAFAPSATEVLERYVRHHWVKRTPTDVDETWPAAWLAEKFRGVRYVIVPAGRKPGLRGLSRAFDRSRSFAPVATASDGDRIYAFRPENVPLSEGGQGGEELGEVPREEGEPVGHEQ